MCSWLAIRVKPVSACVTVFAWTNVHLRSFSSASLTDYRWLLWLSSTNRSPSKARLGHFTTTNWEEGKQSGLMEDQENRQRERGKEDGGQSKRGKKRKRSEVTELKPFHLPSKLLSHEASLTFTGSLSPGRTAGSSARAAFVVGAGAICVSG